MALIQTATPVASYGSSVTITFPGSTPVTSGNSIILKFYKASDAISITSVEDNTATALTLDLTTSLDTDSNGRFYSLHGITDGPVSVTITFSGSVTYSVLMSEHSGLSGTVRNTIAATADGEGSATDHSWEFTSGAANDLGTFLGGAFTGFPTDTATGTGGTVVQQVDLFGVQCHKYAAAAGSDAATFTLTNTRENNYCGVVYAASGGGGSVVPVVAATLLRMMNN